MENIIKEALKVYNDLKNSGEIPTSKQFYKVFSKRRLAKAFEGGEVWSKLQKLAGDKPRVFASKKSNLDIILKNWGTLSRKTLEKHDKFPVQSDWDHNKLQPTISGIEKSHKIKWSEFPRLFYEKFKNDNSWSDITSKISVIFSDNQEIEEIQDENCYVYLIKDVRNNSYKIGISITPKMRERTLQSEQPKIKLIAAKKYINRKIAGAIEKALHETYGHKRQRGEWFILDEEDIRELTDTLDDINK